ncbi:maleylpyruvate isomerase family mycothiol-dependent enzyme [Streptomyces sp. NPDC021093]|uniref:maleylpyruvate isomerase family mycothiol-dependent enzyme n=1 Tax=Streptomyces sp. NPDC021093 TaxID=3365112 RepID=UPI00378A2B61
MRIDAYVNSLVEEGVLLASAAEAAGTGSDVPTCPGWQVRGLLRHTGTVHRWATLHVAHGHRDPQPDGGEPDLDGAELLAWFREGHAALVAALRAAPADLECWTFLPAPSPLAFWARRQAHETAVHRMDAEAATGAQLSGVSPEFALDGIDELLTAFHGRARSRVRTDRPSTLRIRATDTGTAPPGSIGDSTGTAPAAVWTLYLSKDAPPRTVRDDEGPADTELSGPPELLYATLWNRLPTEAVTLTGDPEPAAVWRELSGITW